MKQGGYAPPGARVADVLPQAPGPIPDWAAVLVGTAISSFLPMEVVWEVAIFSASVFTEDDELGETSALVVDLGLTYGAELFAFWMTLHLCRSRSLKVVGLTAALCWLIRFVDRWVIGGYDYPLWDEIALLCTIPLAFATLYARARRSRAVA